MTKTESMGLRDRQKQETRQHIQEAARLLITEYGYEKTTMRALAKAAGVGVGTISLHFKDKKSLLLASFHDEIGEMVVGAIEAAPKEEPLREQFLFILRSVYSYYGTHTNFLRSVVKEALLTRGEWRIKFDKQIERCAFLIAELVEAAQSRGEVRPDVDSMAVAMVGWSLYVNGLVQGLNADTFDVDRQVAAVAPLLDIVLCGVLTNGEGL